MGDSVVLVVAARHAEDTARRWSIYCCQNRRSFRDAEYIAFYRDNGIGLYARIESVEDDYAVADDPSLADYQAERLRRGVKAPPKNKLMRLGQVTEVGPIVNDKVDGSGKRTAWCQSHRYTTLRQLLAAKNTSDLE